MFLMPSTLTVTEKNVAAKCFESVFDIDANNTHCLTQMMRVAELNKPVRDTHLPTPHELFKR